MEEGWFSHAMYIFKVLFRLGFAYRESYIGNKKHRTGEKVSKSCWQSWRFIFFKKKSHRKGMLLWKDTAINCSYLLAGGLEISHWQRQSSSATTFKLNHNWFNNHLNGEYRTWKAFLIHETQRVFLVSNKQVSLQISINFSCGRQIHVPSSHHPNHTEDSKEISEKWERNERNFLKKEGLWALQLYYLFSWVKHQLCWGHL